MRASIFVLALCIGIAAIVEACEAAEPYKSTADYYTQAFLGGKPYTPAVECGRKCYRSLQSGVKVNSK